MPAVPILTIVDIVGENVDTLDIVNPDGIE
jgi:hypothetical protein